MTNRECPWRCLMCDLWRQALPFRVQPGDIPAQIDGVLTDPTAVPGEWDWIKLYNAGSFFDPGAIPRGDRKVIADQVRRFPRVIVENHPSLTDRRILPFRDQLQCSQLEVAMGLETAHPGVLDRLNKRFNLDGFRRAADFLACQKIDLRVFVLVKPPFLEESEALEWACRSLDFAFDCGAKVVSLIPTRTGNGAMEVLAREGVFAPPRFETLEAAFTYGLNLSRGRVFVDHWQLEQGISNPEAIHDGKPRLLRMNARQHSIETSD